MKWTYIFISFIIFSFVGWLIEVIGVVINERKFINRGFLIGPYCPIYGVGGVSIALFLSKFYESPIALFILAMVVCAFLEYVTSYLMEKLFHARWWDYSQYKYNINGRICLETMIPFGILGCVVVYIADPLMRKLFSLLPFETWNIIAIIMVALFIIDLIISLKVVTNFKKKATQFLESDNTEEITKRVKEYLDEVSSLVNTRLVKAFPNVNRKLNEIKENLKKMKEDSENSNRNSFLNRMKSLFKKEK